MAKTMNPKNQMTYDEMDTNSLSGRLSWLIVAFEYFRSIKGVFYVIERKCQSPLSLIDFN